MSLAAIKARATIRPRNTYQVAARTSSRPRCTASSPARETTNISHPENEWKKPSAAAGLIQ